MEKKLPSSTKVVVIGGGVVGCSVAYHLAKFGWKDTYKFSFRKRSVNIDCEYIGFRNNLACSRTC